MDREVALFWKRKPTGASILFFANRYLALALSLFTSVFNVLPYVSIEVSTYHACAQLLLLTYCVAEVGNSYN